MFYKWAILYSWSPLSSTKPPTVRVLFFTDPSGRTGGGGASKGRQQQQRQRRLVFDTESVRRDESAAAGGEKYDEVVDGVGYKVGWNSFILRQRHNMEQKGSARRNTLFPLDKDISQGHL